MIEITPFLIAILSFGAVSAGVYVLGQYLATQSQMQRRLPVSTAAVGVGDTSASAFQSFIARNFDEKRFGVDNTLRGKLRRELVRAGYFRRDALNIYIFSRLVAAFFAPLIAYIASEIFLSAWYEKLFVVAVALALAIIGPDIYLDRRQRALAKRYRQLFPDFLDLLVVCIDAGLSLEAALDRVTGQVVKQHRALGLNLMMMSAETRAGRSTIDALDQLADRLGTDEARSLVLVLRQSLELGTDIGDTLRVFSDDMRDKRVFRAEENANKLPVKMSLPLGLFIFPVILLVVLYPVAIRMLTLMAIR
jgi:tight adherence protein C